MERESFQEDLELQRVPQRIPTDGSPTRRIKIERGRIENERLRKEWRLCCSNSDPQAIKYFVSVSFSISVLIFSIIQIIRNVDDKSIYYNLLSLIIGIFIKSPELVKKGDRN